MDTKKKVLFIDRDGTLVIEPPVDYQLDSLEKLEFYPKVFRNLGFVRSKLDFEFVMVTNQDGLGTSSFPEETFWPAHNLMLKTLAGEGIAFDDILIDRSFPEDNAPTRKPRTGMLTKYIDNPDYDLAGSFVIGDRPTDVELAKNLGCRAIYLQDSTESLKEKGLENEFALYDRVERLAKEEIMTHRKMFKPVCANVDFYSGFVYTMLGIPEELFTPLFAIARIAGWSAHRLEELLNAGKIIRPAYKYVGHHTEFYARDERE